MTYQETIEYIFSRMPSFQTVGSSGYKPGIESMKTMDAYFGHPHESFRTIHVAGTNGKGSVSHTLASILQSAGYKVGLFTSPHLRDFRERIRVNGEMVPEEFVVEFVEAHRALIEKVCPSFFEVNVAIAFDYFRQEQVDVAVIEVGLGGRLDSTNIITPDLCVITNISMDHMNLLGDTLEQIAAEKAGIIKEGIPVVIGEAEGSVKEVFQRKAEEVNTRICFAPQEECEFIDMEASYKQPFQLLRVGNELVRTPLLGIYQRKNMTTVLSAVKELRHLGYHIPRDVMRHGIEHTLDQTHLMGRWQRLKETPYVVCDTGHNVGGIQYVVQQLESMPCKTLRIVFGMVGDKDVSHVLELLPKHAVYYFTKANSKRAMPETKLKELAEQKGLKGNTYPSVPEAYQAALDDADDEDVVYVGGSTYVVAEIV